MDDTDAQVISMSNDTVFLNNGGFIKLPTDLVDDADANPANEIQDLQLVGNDLTITNNGSATTIDLSGFIDDADANATNEIQQPKIQQNEGAVEPNDQTAEIDGLR